MCGLVAMISKNPSVGFSYKDKDIFNQMLYTDALRGMDSTGVFGINKVGNLDALKEATPASIFQADQDYKEFSQDIYTDYVAVVGHNRSATRGAKTDKNAHPFIEEHICLVHNGTLTTHKGLADVEVDSHAICHSLANKGFKETFENLHGAFALIWYDAKEKKLHIARNSERPLHLVETKDAFYIASEQKMLEWILNRNIGSVPKTLYFDTDKLFTWDMENLDKGFSVSDLPEKKSYQSKQLSIFQETNNITPMFSDQINPIMDITDGSDEKPKTHPKVKIPIDTQVAFYVDSNSCFGDTITFRGYTYDEHMYDAVATISAKNLNTEQVMQLLDAEIVSATFKGVSTRYNKITLILTDIKIEEYYTTSTGEFVSDSALQDHSYTCDGCGTMIDPSEEEDNFWVRLKNGVVKKLLCATCVTNHKHLVSNQ